MSFFKTLAHVFNDVIVYYCLKVADKFIKDNLPDLHYKKIWQKIQPALTLFFIFCYWGMVKLKLIRLSEKQQLALLIAFGAILVLDKMKNMKPGDLNKIIDKLADKNKSQTNPLPGLHFPPSAGNKAD